MNQFRSSAIVHGVAGRSLVGSGDRGEAAEERGRQMLLNYENTLVGAIKEIAQLEGKPGSSSGRASLWSGPSPTCSAGCCG